MIAPTLFKLAAGAGLLGLVVAAKKKKDDDDDDDDDDGGAKSKKSKKSKKPKKRKPGEKPNEALSTLSNADLERMVQALKSGSPSILRAFAAELEKRGFLEAAAELRREADRIDTERANKGEPDPLGTSKPKPKLPPVPTKPAPKPVPTTKPAPKPVPKPVPVKPAPKLPPPLPKLDPASSDDRGALALTVAAHLKGKTKGSENKALVMQFQTQEGLKPDGLYGPMTGKRIAAYGVIPAKPYYWPSATFVKAKEDWKRTMLDHAAKDPARKSQWEAVSNVFGAAATQQPAQPPPAGDNFKPPLILPDDLFSTKGL
jgi:hypothetical protein